MNDNAQGLLNKGIEKLKAVLKDMYSMIVRMWCRYAFDYCDRCAILALINSVVDENEQINYEEAKVK